MESLNGPCMKNNAVVDIPEICIKSVDDDDNELPEYVPLRHTGDPDNESNLKHSKRKRRSGVVNSMEGLNRISTTSCPEDLNSELEENPEDETVFMSPGCSNSSQMTNESDGTMKSNDEETDDYKDELIDEYENQGVRPKINHAFSEGRRTPPIYDETRPRRKKKFEPNFNPNDKLQVYYDETKPKRKVSFDTAINPIVRKHQLQARIDGQPVRKISLDAGLDAQNIRKVSFESNPFDANQAGNSLQKESIGQITFDAESGTLRIRKLSSETSDSDAGLQMKGFHSTNSLSPNDSANMLSPEDVIHPCDTPRKVSYAEPDNYMGNINRGFQNDTYLDNVTFYVQRNMQNDEELKNGHLFNDNPQTTEMAPSSPVKSKGILKGWKSSDVENNSPDTVNNGDQTSSLAAHLRKDSIALTSEKLGQIMDIQKHYKKMHDNEKPFSKQRELVKKYQLHLGVAALFVLTLIIVSIGWHFHHVHKQKKMISQRIFFEAEKRNLNLADPAKRDDIAGKLGMFLPVWQLPSHCSKDSDDQEYQCLYWKNNAKFRIWYYERPSVHCYNVSWEVIKSDLYPRDCYEIGNHVAWYGPSNVTNPSLTNRGINFTFSSSYTHRYNLGDYALTAENYWLSSNGVGIYIARNIPLIVDWNTLKPGWMCFTSNYTGEYYGNKITYAKHFLNYTICNGNDARATHSFMRQLLPEAPQKLPNKSFLQNPLWSTSNQTENTKITEKEVLQKAVQIKKANLTCSSIIIDKTWQSFYGDFEFDLGTFPNISNLQADVRNISGCSLTLTFNPYFEYKSKSFSEGHPENAFVKDPSGHVPALMKWDGKVVAVLDVTNERAVSWLKSKISTLTSQLHIASFVLEYSVPNWVPFHPHFQNRTASPSEVRELFSKLVASISMENSFILGGTSQTQSLAALISVPTYVINTNRGKCLSGSLSSALTLGILGYPFVMADGLRASADVGDIPRDLYIRWMQLASFFPAMRYTIEPWRYDPDCVKMAQNMSILHKKYVMNIIDNMKVEILDGNPILRPIWWNDPSDRDALVVEDEFLVGDDVLIAPVMCEGVTSRKIYFPEGLWSFENGETFIEGNSWIDFTVRSYEVPIFIKKDVLGSS